MALKLLNPGLRPLGQVDLDDDSTASYITGGEMAKLVVQDSDDYYAADVTGMGEGFAAQTLQAIPTALAPVFMCDEGIKGYGTLFGELIGSTVGQATSQSGATVIGPASHTGSGKVTLWHLPGLYAISSPENRDSNTADAGASDAWADALDLSGVSINGSLTAGGTTVDQGKLTTAATGKHVMANYLGGMADDSLVSTTLAAAGETAVAEFEVIYFLGSVGHLAP